ncbi:restriction endonuclease subunit S [Hymenobacter endophyticus]|uniref:Restriction endonuclease subunit S n=1 Tax=Hymenobacter endophyticus TaxID=3076335 RepID=A0ABU3TLV8_9BACT|nr:restriction endonuclease subunit S [Hymenobacter endophyticus]MDU0372349.1 restriction endonuclease subunit S [Hymenobacter endophyticus]
MSGQTAILWEGETLVSTLVTSELVNEWPEYSLGELGKVITGNTPSKDNPGDWGEAMPFITPSDYKNYRKKAAQSIRSLSDEGVRRLAKRVLPANSVLVTCIGSDMGKVVMNATEAVTNQQINALVPNNDVVDANFLYYSLVSLHETLVTHGSDGTAVPILNKGDFEKLTVQIPPLAGQRAIASVLSSLDEKIDLLHRQNATLEALAETLFRQWFVEATNNLKPGKFGDWVEGTIGGEWGKEVSEGEFIQPAYCIRGTDIADLQIGLAYKTPLRFVKPKKFESIQPKTGDIIIEISGGTENQSTGRALYINDDIKSFYSQPLIFSNFCRMIRPINEQYSFFIYLYIQYLYKQDEFFGLENGSSGIKNLDYKALLFEIEYLMPTEDRVLEFDKQVSPYYSKINQNKRQVQTLEKLRDTLLPKLMSGDVRVAY